MGTTYAYCFRDGCVMFGSSVPEGAIELCNGSRRQVAKAIEDTTDDRWIPNLKESTSVADDQQHLLIYLEALKDAAPATVTVMDLTQELLEAES